MLLPSRVANLGIVSMSFFVEGVAVSVCVLTTAENWVTEAIVQSNSQLQPVRLGKGLGLYLALW